MRLFLSIIALLLSLSFPSLAQTQGTAMRATNGIGFARTLIAGHLHATNTLQTNTIAGSIQQGGSASSLQSAAFGLNTAARATAAFVTGIGNTSLASGSLVGGRSNLVGSGSSFSLVSGELNQVNAFNSFVVGNNNFISSDYSAAIGRGHSYDASAYYSIGLGNGIFFLGGASNSVAISAGTNGLTVTEPDSFFVKANGGSHFTGGPIYGDASGLTNIVTANLHLPETTPTAGIIYQSSLTGSSNVFHTYGTNNLFVGRNSGNFTTTTSLSTGVGIDTLRSVTTGNQLTAFGFKALENATTGNYNEAIGYGALLNLTEGSYNTAVGQGALESVTTTGSSVAVGFHSLILNTQYNNTAVGYNGLPLNHAGFANVAVGDQAGALNETGANLVLLGSGAGYYETGTAKLYIDSIYRASEADGRIKSLMYGVFDALPANQFLTVNGRLLVSGTGNSGIGTINPSNTLEVLAAISGGGITINTAGTYSGINLNNGGVNQWGLFNNLNSSGDLSFYDNLASGGLGTRFIIDTSGNVGIGTTNPTAKLYVLGSTTVTNGQLTVFTPTAGTGVSIDTSDIYSGITLKNNGENQWGILNDLNEAGDLSFYDYLASGGQGTRLILDTSGNVGIGTIAPVQKLSVNGSAGFTNGIASFSTVASVAIAASGWTNIWSTNNAVVSFDGTTIFYTNKLRSNASYYTNVAALGHAMVILQPGEAVDINGTGVTGVAKPF